MLISISVIVYALGSLCGILLGAIFWILIVIIAIKDIIISQQRKKYQIFKKNYVNRQSYNENDNFDNKNDKKLLTLTIFGYIIKLSQRKEK